ncbi:type IX secretion system membrane protein PorP/SprF [Rufibacter sp. LB8]|uniref:PorP/SprF family type IX secretion system membrane protein n=1 Tax=Rufibacter sp. LB8 TaxID=2777781 RepID=UPI00178C7C44|nr:type IX secretion system membrane protein PorP/SprF [Rufibacter sp. LB8]
MKKLALFAALLLGMFQATAQQKPQYSQYLFNNYLLNPALSGIESYTDVRMGTRRQWVGIDGAPVTYYLSAHTSLGTSDRNAPTGQQTGKGFIPKMPVANSRKNKYHKSRPHHGFGAMAQVDRTGPLSNSSLTATYAYHHPLTRRINMSVGIASGLVQSKLDGNAIRMGRENDPAMQHGQLTKTKFDLGLGTWIYSDNFYVGFSAAQLLTDKIKKDEGLDAAQHELQPHFFGTAGYRLRIRYDLSLEPSVMVKLANPSPAAVDFNLKTTYANRIWAGVSYRHQDAVAVMTGMNVNHILDIGYSYDLTTSELSNASAGSHELIVGIKLHNKGRLLCPQWLW